jgi:hypothetical protein
MCRPSCPTAPALFGSIAGSASGAAVGAVAGWLMFVAFWRGGGTDPGGLAILVFGTLGMGIGGSGGAVGGMISGWGLASGKAHAEGTAARWGGGLGALWGLQPILWLATRVDALTTLRSAAEILLAVSALGAVAGVLGALTARQVVRNFVLVSEGRRP